MNPRDDADQRIDELEAILADSKRILAIVRAYTIMLAERFGDRVDEWGTWNEPMNYVLAAYGLTDRDLRPEYLKMGPAADRMRDGEFEDRQQSRAELLAEWEHGWQCVFNALTPLTDADLQRTVVIRGEPHSVYKAISRQVAHYAGHAYQILFLAKHLQGSNWKTLSIPRGQSDEFNRRMLAKLKADA